MATTTLKIWGYFKQHWRAFSCICGFNLARKALLPLFQTSFSLRGLINVIVSIILQGVPTVPTRNSAIFQSSVGTYDTNYIDRKRPEFGTDCNLISQVGSYYKRVLPFLCYVYFLSSGYIATSLTCQMHPTNQINCRQSVHCYHHRFMAHFDKLF